MASPSQAQGLSGNDYRRGSYASPPAFHLYPATHAEDIRDHRRTVRRIKRTVVSWYFGPDFAFKNKNDDLQNDYEEFRLQALCSTGPGIDAVNQTGCAPPTQRQPSGRL